MSFLKHSKPDLTPASSKDKKLASQGKTHYVTYPVSYRYNGGIIVNEKWYEGFKVPAPKVPKGWKLVNIGVGLQLNACPPYATSCLQKI